MSNQRRSTATFSSAATDQESVRENAPELAKKRRLATSPMAQSSNTTYSRPRTRQRIHKEPPALDVPDINEDAAERKRVLNVLAQRRYRERKRQSRSAVSPQSEETGPSQGPESSQAAPLSVEQPRADTSESPSTEDAPPQAEAESIPTPALPTMAEISLADITTGLDLDPSATWSSALDDFPVSSLLIDNNTIPDLTFDPQLLLFTTGSSPPPSSSTAPSTVDPSALFDASSSSSTATDTLFSFPDSYLLPVNELTLLRAFLRIASRLGCTNTVWDLNATSPFYAGTSPADLPQTWRPTPAQVLVAHHPLLDFLPWPSAREKVIRVLTLPEDVRPPTASGPLAVVQFAYDMEDGAEGIRIWGGDPYDPASWEIGQLLFERWWFIFDRDIIEQSNRWRELRGSPRLKLT